MLRRVGVLAALFTLGLVACQPAPAASPSNPAPPAAAAPAGGAGAPASRVEPTPAAPLGTIVAHAGVTPNVSTVWVAADLGFDQQYGLTIDVQRTRAAAISQAALAAGEIDYAWTGLPPFLAARAGGSDVVFIGATTTRTAADLVVRPPISTAEELRGKTFGVQSFGGPPHIRTLAALLRLGVDPTRDGVSIITTGDEPTTTAALLEGAIDGAAVSYTASADPKARGYHAWDLGKLGIPEITGIVTRNSQLREQPEVTRRLLRALAAANAYIRSIGSDAAARQRVGEAVGKRLQTDPDKVLLQLDEIRDSLPVDLRIPVEEGREQQTLTAIVQPDVAGLAVEEWLNQSFLEQLQQEGFFDRLGGR
jgi:ABC-type nitrate/sulfonate/bicarbonate transport system substrate-binding protein